MRTASGFTAAAVFVCLIVLVHCGNRNSPPVEAGPLPQVDLSTLDRTLSDGLAPKLAILRENPEDVSANGDAAKLLHAYQQFELAARFYQRAQTLQPSGSQWPFYLGVIHATQGRYGDAIDSFNAVLAVAPAFVPAKKRLARALLDDRKLDESLRVYRALLTNEPNDAEIRNGLGRVNAAMGNLEDAVVHLSRAVEIQPNYGEAHYALALAHRDLGDEASAIDHLKLYENDKLGAPPGVDPLMTAVNSLRSSPVEYLRAGLEAQKAERFRDAIRYNLKALQLDPNEHQAHVSLIVLYGIVGEPDSARQHYRKALALNPNSVALHHNYGRLLYDEDAFSQAILSFARALEINPEDAFVNNDMGETSEHLGQLDEAIRYYRRAVANRPDYTHAHFNLGRTMMQRGRTADAIREFRLALQEETFRTPTYLATLASAQASLGMTSEATTTLDLARRMAEKYGQGQLIKEIDNDIDRLASQSRR